MADLFNTVWGQPKVRAFLRAAVAAGRVSHAYLFCGPVGAGKTQAALSFAQAVLCPLQQQGAVMAPSEERCGSCPVCRLIREQKHPDVRFLHPEGAGGYLVDQIREVVADAALAPIQAQRKVYLIDRADLLGIQAANAFLKTLEEPPDDVLIVLLARTKESVLPTLVSRCQVLPFRTIPEHEAAGIVAQNAAVSLPLARIALAAGGGSVTRAVAYMASKEQQALRAQVLQLLGNLETYDAWNILQACEGLALAAKNLAEGSAQNAGAAWEGQADFLDKAQVKTMEQRAKRAAAAAARENLHRITAVCRSFLRDAMACAAGASDSLVNEDVRSDVLHLAACCDLASLARSFSFVDRCEQAISYNVSAETCLDALFLELQTCLFRPAGC